ncbi:MAG: cobyrinate a,c-diamide synthase [Acetobacteraceae bacterium]|nr:cobyrinate a,c-diamide synthase [Acetobacteraceae bacterium]
MGEAVGPVTRALIVAAPRSGAGKTTVVLALLAAFHRRGVAVRAAKSGPDYIDPAFHEAVTGHPSLNIDSWAMPPHLIPGLAAEAAAGADLLLIEASMGLFDGLGRPPGRSGSAADIAARLGLPVLLVLDVSGQSQSAAAVARGFALHRPDVRVGGIVLNRIASERHREGILGAMRDIPLAVLGSLDRDDAIRLPERHLGLVQAQELGELGALIERLADLAEDRLDLDAIQSLAAPLPSAAVASEPALPPPGQRIAVARDAAFSFIYPHLLAGWRRAGAEIHPFSPLADEAPPEGCDMCWLPGGYPELHAGALASATRFLAGLRRFAAGRPVHGECGGHMVLGRALIAEDGTAHEMLGLLHHVTSFARRRLTLGYRGALLLSDGPLGRARTRLRGHEFHYATVAEPGGDAPFAMLTDGGGRDLGPSGGRSGRVTGSFFHAIAANAEKPA